MSSLKWGHHSSVGKRRSFLVSNIPSPSHHTFAQFSSRFRAHPLLSQALFMKARKTRAQLRISGRCGRSRLEACDSAGWVCEKSPAAFADKKMVPPLQTALTFTPLDSFCSNFGPVARKIGSAPGANFGPSGHFSLLQKK